MLAAINTHCVESRGPAQFTEGLLALCPPNQAFKTPLISNSMSNAIELPSLAYSIFQVLRLTAHPKHKVTEFCGYSVAGRTEPADGTRATR